MKRIETDLLGMPLPAPDHLRKDGGRRKIGYAARPGTGPKGQRCNTCVHAQFMRSTTRLGWKCDRVTHRWSDSEITDIQPRAPACREWERKPLRKIA